MMLTNEQFEVVLSHVRSVLQQATDGWRKVMTSEQAQAPDSALLFSNPVDLLAAALATAQGEMETVVKLKEVNMATRRGNVNYTYASLADIMRVCRIPLAKNGLSVAQQLLTDSKGSYVMVTLLLHNTGQWMRAVSPIPFMGMPGDNSTSAQAHGSLIAYARRYALISLLNIVTDDHMDDDGQRGQAVVNELPQAQETRGTPVRQVVYDAVESSPEPQAAAPAQNEQASQYSEAYINYYNVLLGVRSPALVASVYAEAARHLSEAEQKLFKRHCAKHYESIGGTT